MNAAAASANGTAGRPEGRPLRREHLADLRRSGLTDDQINRCRFYSLTDPGEIARVLQWRCAAKSLGACLAIPFCQPDGSVNGFTRLKPNKPRVCRGKFVKYEQPKGVGNRAYFP